MAREDGHFKKGNVANPGGRPKLSPEAKAFRKMSHDQFLSKLQEYSHLTREEFKTLIADPKLTMFDVIFANIVGQAAKGDRDARNLIIERLWGKVPEVSHIHQTDDEEPIPLQDIADYLRYKRNEELSR